MSVAAVQDTARPQHHGLQIPHVGDVSSSVLAQGERIDVRIEITLSQLDPPEGLAVRALRPGDGPMAEPREFVGWLGLFEVLQSLTAESVDQAPE